jgi:hypothetical protein
LHANRIFRQILKFILLETFQNMRKHIRDLPARQRGTGLTCNERTRAKEALDTAIMASVAQSYEDSTNSEFSDMFDESIIEFYQINHV